MSRVELDRLVGWRNFKNDQLVGVWPVVSALPADYVSARYVTRSDLIERFEKISDCCTKIEGVETSPGVVNVVRGNHCKTPSICPICSSRVQSRRRAVYLRPILDAMNKYRYRYMLVFTIKNGENLTERLDFLRDSFRRWYLMGQRRGGVRSGGEAAKIEAAISSVEITRGAGGYHVHLHVLAFCSDMIDYRLCGKMMFKGVEVDVSKLSTEWLAASLGQAINISITPLCRDAAAMRKTALEVLKYNTKLNCSAGSAADLVEIVAATYQRRLFAAYRGFRGLLSVQGEYVEDRPDVSTTMIWDSENGQYRRVPVLRRDVSADKLKIVGSVVGQWRRDRRAAIGAGRSGLAARLDGLKRVYRVCIREIWRAACRQGIIDACAPVLRESVRLPEWVQASLFTT